MDNPPFVPKLKALASYLKANPLSDRQRNVLLAQYAAPNHVARTQQMAEVLGLTMVEVNNAYGTLGRRVANALVLPLPKQVQPTQVLSAIEKLDDGHWRLHMREPVARAIERLRWAHEALRRFGAFYETVESIHVPGRRYLEGRLQEARVIARARSGRARQECIEIHGAVCVPCGFDFEAAYGARGRGFIEVHHLKPMASIDAEYEIDPKEDLCPVCSNCHRMIHREGDMLSIPELRDMIAQARAKP